LAKGVRQWDTHGDDEHTRVRYVTAHDLNDAGEVVCRCECEACRAIEGPQLTAREISEAAWKKAGFPKILPKDWDIG